MGQADAVVALTDERWFEFLSSIAADGRLDEANFWRPLAQTEFHAVPEGAPFFFRLKHPMNAIAGYGFFAHATRLPISLVWEAFAERNGDATFEGFLNRIAEYRHESPMEVLTGDRQLMCLIVRNVRFFTRAEWLGWGSERDWSPNIVAFKTYDLSVGAGAALARVIRNGRPPEFERAFDLITQDARMRVEQSITAREGQGAFRVRVLDAYDRRCAVTGERSLPVLDAAHIQPYMGAASNHVQNGLALRADIHRLYDAGYVTVTPDVRFEVSRRLREDYENGRVYYELDGQPLKIIPKRRDSKPSAAALEWHSANVFR